MATRKSTRDRSRLDHFSKLPAGVQRGLQVRSFLPKPNRMRSHTTVLIAASLSPNAVLIAASLSPNAQRFVHDNLKTVCEQVSLPKGSAEEDVCKTVAMIMKKEKSGFQEEP